ncbi:MAG: hypothetical protein ACYDD4_05305 [Acidimicrobiales bacterium]
MTPDRFPGWWLVAEPLTEGERVIVGKVANRMTGPMSYSNGKLFMTDRRLIFVPGRTNFPASLRQVWQVSRTEVRNVTTTKLSIPILPLRTALEVKTQDGSDAFVVWRPQRVALNMAEFLLHAR